MNDQEAIRRRHCGQLFFSLDSQERELACEIAAYWDTLQCLIEKGEQLQERTADEVGTLRSGYGETWEEFIQPALCELHKAGRILLARIAVTRPDCVCGALQAVQG